MKDIFLIKESLNNYSDEEEIALLQLFWMINNLRSWISTINNLGKVKQVYTCDVFDVYYILSSIFYEVHKTFFRDVYPKLKKKNSNIELSNRINEWEQIWTKYREDKLDVKYQIIDVLRNSIAFHFKSDFIKEIYTPGKNTEDIQIGFTITGNTGDTRYTNVMNYILTKIIKLLDNKIDENVILKYFKNEILFALIDKRCSLLEELVSELIGNNIYLKPDH